VIIAEQCDNILQLMAHSGEVSAAVHVMAAFDARDYIELEMWANAQRDGRPAEYRWRPLFNAAKFG